VGGQQFGEQLRLRGFGCCFFIVVVGGNSSLFGQQRTSWLG